MGVETAGETRQRCLLKADKRGHKIKQEVRKLNRVTQKPTDAGDLTQEGSNTEGGITSKAEGN